MLKMNTFLHKIPVNGSSKVFVPYIIQIFKDINFNFVLRQVRRKNVYVSLGKGKIPLKRLKRIKDFYSVSTRNIKKACVPVLYDALIS